MRPDPDPPHDAILVIDPDRGILAELAGAAVRLGMTLHCAGSGAEAVDKARRQRPGAIAVDPLLPDLPPLAILDVLRHDTATAGVPVVAVGHPTAEAASRARGVAAFVGKPISADALLWRLRGVGAARPRDGAPRVLVVDDDPSCRELCVHVLAMRGFEVTAAGDTLEARAALSRATPDVLLLDVCLPGGSGLSILDWLRGDASLRHVPVVFMTSIPGRRHLGELLSRGGDDGLLKPFDTGELVARVEGALARSQERVSLSPNTLLPGTWAIDQEVKRRNRLGADFGFCYLDIDHFKAYNDTYGYARADAVIRQVAELLRRSVKGRPATPFLGHVAGDDFILIGAPATCDDVVSEVLREFDAVAPLFYRSSDRKARGIDAEDRSGRRRRFPLMTLSAVGVLGQPPDASAAALSDAAAPLKARGKRVPRSVFLRTW